MATVSAQEKYDDSSKGVWAFTGAAFGAVMLITVGALQILEGIAAVLQDHIFVAGPRYAYALNVQTWGWIHLVMGVIGVLVGIGIFRGAVWGMIAGIVVAGLMILTNFAFVPYYPFWSLAIIAISVFVIWSLCTLLAHRDEL
jgi:hypothetical protein